MNPLFKVHKLNSEEFEKAKTIAKKFDELLSTLEPLAYPGRELALAKTHLEQACIYLKRAIAIDPTDQDES